MSKTCSVCNQVKPIEEFDFTSIGTRTTRCITCRKAYDKRRRSDPIIKARMKKGKQEWFQRPDVKERAKRKAIAWRSTLNGALRTLLFSIKRRDSSSDITLSMLFELWEIQRGRCAQTNILMSTENGTADTNNLWKVSVDRVDHTKGYLANNIQLVCCGYNFAKNNNSDEIMQKFLRGISYQYVIDNAIFDISTLDMNRL